MSKDLVISSSRHETKAAILEDEQLVEIYFQRANEYSLAGSIHKGRVTRVLPGMQSAFVDIGLERDAFLYVSDFFEESEEYEHMGRGEAKTTRERPAQAPPKVQAPPPETADAGAESKDRRGRKQRRRRTRGRGFPESKYAREEAQPAERTESAETDEDFLLLPGESVAKYKRAHDMDGEPEGDALAEEPDVAFEEEAAGEELTADGDEDVEVLEAEVVSVELIEAAGDEAEEESSMDDPADEDGSAWVAEAEEDGASEGAFGEVETGVESADEVFEVYPAEQEAGLGAELTEDFLQTVAAEDTEGGLEDAEPEITGAVETEGEEEAPEDLDIQEMILGALGEEPVEWPGETEPPGSSEGAQPVATGGEGGATASIREQSSRYMHRISRRSRRRQRGKGFEPQHDVRSRPQGETPKVAEAARPAEVKIAEKALPQTEKPATASITDLLKEGKEVLVQVAKEPMGQKGARITSHIALPGRYVVYMPMLDHLGVSRKIASDEERARLRRILQTHGQDIPGGYIVRTAGEGQSESDIAADMTFLYELWLDIRRKAEKRAAPALLHHDLDIVERLLRDQLTGDFKTIWVDNEDLYEAVLHFLERFQPSLLKRVRLYTRSTHIFDAFNISAELEKALRPKVWLKSGGYIVINQTEALVAIDINTGKFVGKSNRLEDTIVKTNLEAVKEIVRQVRLRDLGGIIVIDFIDMDERKNRLKVMQALEETMRADRAPCKILQFNDFGLVAITRKRVKQSLERTLCSPCPYCEGAAYVKSVQTVIGEILQQAHKMARALEGEEVTLRVHPDVAKQLKSTRHKYLEELDEVLGKQVMVVSDAQLHHEKFDLV